MLRIVKMLRRERVRFNALGWMLCHGEQEITSQLMEQIKQGRVKLGREFQFPTQLR